ncbi:hypothetical protein JCM19297_2127 [Nonlabens ulvanivorans]|nr:hypothetical protein [Nonlabens ulvanivorans]GAK90115.1 hypothetical protein JCM19297_2127 [Nonlabens ulvanivorans]
MKKYILLSVIAVTTIITVLFVINSTTEDLSEIALKRQQHKEFLDNSPFKDTRNLSKEKRKKLSLPPNAYNEREWELTMNPALGIPTPFLVEPTTPSLYTTLGAPGNNTTPWQERGPLNTGGRTRVVFFDPTDVGGK